MSTKDILFELNSHSSMQADLPASHCMEMDQTKVFVIRCETNLESLISRNFGGTLQFWVF